jgi:hypothetical protein
MGAMVVVTGASAQDRVQIPAQDRVQFRTTLDRERSRELRFDVMPYGGSKLGDVNDQAIPGAMVEFGPGRNNGKAGVELSREEKVAAQLQEMGVRDGSEFGDQGRWYAFVGGSGKALGFNMRRAPDGLLRSYGFSVDPAAAVGDVEAGLGWRKGDFQASAGYVHRTFKPAYGMENIDYDNKDEMVGLSFSLKTHPPKSGAPGR